MKGKLLDIELEILRKSQKKASDRISYIKVTVILLLDLGKSVKEIEMILGIDDSTIYRYIDDYNSVGLEKYLETNYKGYWGKLSCTQISTLRNELKSRLYTTSKEINGWIKDNFDVDYTEKGVVKLLKRIGFSYKQTKQVPCESNIAAQEKFVEELSELLKTTADNKAVIYYVDGVHPTHNTRSTYGWIEKGSDFEQPTVSGRDRVNINGAINAMVVDEVHVVECQSVNAQSTKELYSKLIEKNTTANVIYTISDNAKYYRNRELNEWMKNTKIKPVFLPPYSPNLNLIERLWKFLRKEVINKTFYRTKEEFKAAIMYFFDHIKDYKENLETLMTLKFHISKSVNSG